MFVDFNRLMKQEEEPKSRIPEALVEYLNKKLPEGVKYHKTKDGDYCLLPDENGNFSMGELVFKPNEHQKKVLGKKCSFDDILEYIYNSQKPMRIGTKDGKTVLVNGERIPLSDLFLSPHIDLNDENFIQYIYPQKFPVPQLITLSCDNIEQQIYIQRVANDSVHERIFESLENELIFFQLKLNDNSPVYSITIKINLHQIKRIHTLITAMKICNAFTSGKLKIDDKLIEIADKDKQKNRFEQQTIDYWEKLLKIEQVLNLEFKPNSNEVDFQTANEVEKLYQCLINKVPYKENRKFNTITGNWNVENEIDNSIGKSIYLTFEGQEGFNLYGQEFDLFYRTYIFNCIFKKIEKEESGKITLHLDDISEDKMRYTSTLLFQSEDELDNYDFEKNIDKFQNARTYLEYTQNN